MPASDDDDYVTDRLRKVSNVPGRYIVDLTMFGVILGSMHLVGMAADYRAGENPDYINQTSTTVAARLVNDANAAANGAGHARCNKSV